MYSDLLLGLVVLFMATVSFVPDINIGKPASAYAYSRHFDQVFEATYTVKEVSAAQLEGDIATFLAVNKLPAESVVEGVQFVGGYDAATEKATDGIKRAVEFSAALDQQDPRLLKNASTTVDGSTILAPNQIAIKMKFGVTIR